MKEVLKAEMLDVNPEDYYNESKGVYSTIPVFPLLDEAQIRAAILESVDTSRYWNEIEYLNQKERFTQVNGTNYQICLINWTECPELTQLLTIIREWAFRNEGGGVGSNDYDQFDELEKMMQLIIVDLNATEIVGSIVGGYRYLIHDYDSYSTGPVGAHFDFTEQWKNEVWIELGRSFINPYFQIKNQRKSFDLVLHGLGYIYANNLHAKGYFGKITLYKVYERQKADAYFLAVAKEYMKTSEGMKVFPAEKVAEGQITEDQKNMLDRDVFKGLFYTLRTDFKINLVPIMAIYNRLTNLKNMYYCGAFRHRSFGDSIEMGIVIAFEDINDVIQEKFARPYLKG